MNDEKNEIKNASREQSPIENAERAEPGEAGRTGPDALLAKRPPRSQQIEIKGPPGMAVSVAGDEQCTKIVLRLLVEEDGATP